MFEKTLNDMIKGIRANPQSEAQYIASSITESKTELGSREPSVKQQACLKLLYLHMLGHDVGWAAFHFVDMMAAQRFRGKRVGFLGAAQTFHDGTDVLLLTTNLFRKAFASSVQYEASLGLNCLAMMVTPDLARDLLGDVLALVANSRPLVRKKAVIALYRLLRRFPEALPTAFPRLRERLDDPDPDVVSCTVNVLTELATENPKGYLGLAPALYKVLTTSSSNWTLIKVVKFLRQLVPHEPRLARKLVQPLSHLIETTPAKSLQFECLYTVASTMAASQPELAAVAATHLRSFVEASDPNLKSLGLLALAELQAADKALLEPCRDAILGCLDEEVSVRTKALALIAGMVSRANLADLVGKLISQLSASESAYRDEVVAVILSSCRSEGFAHVPSFRWLVTTLFSLAALHSSHGADVAQLMVEVTLRVPAVRGFAAERSVAVLMQVASSDFPDAAQADAALLSAAWVLGEHGARLPPASQRAALDALLSPAVSALAAEVQASCVQSALRLLVQLPLVDAVVAAGGLGPPSPPFAAADDDLLAPSESPGPGSSGGTAGDSGALYTLLLSYRGLLWRFCGSSHPEVAERATSAYQALSLALGREDGSMMLADGASWPDEGKLALLSALRSGLAPELRAVAPKAQKRVRPPPGLDLETPLYTPPPPPPEPETPPPSHGSRWEGGGAEVPAEGGAGCYGRGDKGGGASSSRPSRPPPSGPFYLPSEPSGGPVPSEALGSGSPGKHGAEGGVAAQAPPLGGGMPGGADAAAGAAFSYCAGTSYGDEGDSRAVVDLDEAMPEGAADDEFAAQAERQAYAAVPSQPPLDSADPAAHPSTQPSGPMLVDLLEGSPSAPGMEAVAGEEQKGRRRRKKHRSTDGHAPAGGESAGLQAPLVTL